LGSNNIRRFLIVASSGRALAASARRAGFECAVLDLFADLDLDTFAGAHARIARGAAGGFDADDLIAEAGRLAPPDPDSPFGLVYGSGFEDRPELLGRLAHGRELFGNGAETLTRSKDPFAFARLLDRLGLPHPEIRRGKPADHAAWLAKRIGGAGGIHIRYAKDEKEAAGSRYYQRFVEGSPVSALVIADGSEARVLGFSEQWAAPGSLAQPFRFGGAAAPADISGELAERLEEAALAIARGLNLTGLNSVDFIAEPGRGDFHVIEVNPRPGASLDVFERIGKTSLFALHVQACRGELPQGGLNTTGAAASAILYADRDLRIAPGFSWPEWTADRPRAGLWLKAGEPICTVLAEAHGGGDPAPTAVAQEIAMARSEALRAAISRCMQSSSARDPVAPAPRGKGGTGAGRNKEIIHVTNRNPMTAGRPSAARKADWPSVSRGVEPWVNHLIEYARELRVGVKRTKQGATIIDAGIDYTGGIEAGRVITEICMGGLGRVSVAPAWSFKHWPWAINVRSTNPVLACLGSQYAGWSLSFAGFSALGSGPGRALAAREELFAELGYKDKADSAVLVLEADKTPPGELIEKVSRDCGISPKKLTIILTPTASLAGATQVVGRVLEVALHKVHALKFPLDRIVDGLGSAPLPPPAKDFVSGMGRTNDAIIYGGTVQLFVTGPDEDAKKLARDLPSCNSRDYGKPFAEVFKAYKGDFYAIDGMLFSPARAIVSALDSGHTFESGAVNEALLDRSFGHEGA
jgi:methenyltetrahydromethanopterin cyclohydrolase